MLIAFGSILLTPFTNSDSAFAESQSSEIIKVAKYIPYDAYFTVHLHLDPRTTPKYIEIPSIRNSSNQFKENLIKAKNDLFTIAGLNYENGLSKCIQSDYSISIINSNDNSKDWILAIEGNQNIDEEGCIKNYWQKKEEDGIKISNEDYKGKEILISSLNKKSYMASAFTDENIVLMSPNIDLLHKSIDIANDSNRNQVDNQYNNYLTRNIGDQTIILRLSKKSLQDLIGLPDEILEEIEDNKIFALLNIKGNKIHLDGISELSEIINPIGKENLYDIDLSDYSFLKDKDIAMVNNPKRILTSNDNNLYYKLIGYYLRDYINNINSPIVKKIMESESGAIILENNNNDWKIESSDNSIISKLNEQLIANKFIRSTINLENKIFNIWFKLDINEYNNNYNISEKIGLISSEESNKVVLGNKISNFGKENISELFLLSINQSDIGL